MKLKRNKAVKYLCFEYGIEPQTWVLQLYKSETEDFAQPLEHGKNLASDHTNVLPPYIYVIFQSKCISILISQLIYLKSKMTRLEVLFSDKTDQEWVYTGNNKLHSEKGHTTLTDVWSCFKHKLINFALKSNKNKLEN